MIIFDLSCKNSHPFEGWFRSPSDYESQLVSRLISCPQCGSSDIRRVPSAVHLTKQANTLHSAKALPSIDIKSGLLAAYQQIISVIVSNSVDVGKDFAEEVRKIHYSEVPVRSIRGEASAEDYENLREEGIEVLRLPIIKKENLN